MRSTIAPLRRMLSALPPPEYHALHGCLERELAAVASCSSAWNHCPSDPYTSGRRLHTATPAQQDLITLNNLRDNPGATHQEKRLGRGIGSGLGKTSGRGHKGQHARSGRKVKLGFEGGQTPLRLRTPKRGFTNPFSLHYTQLNLDRLQHFADAGRIDTSHVITMKELRDSGAVRRKVVDGIKLLAGGANKLQSPMHLQVSQVSAKAKEAIEARGGSVTTVYYNALGLRALLRPEWFERKGRLLPKAAQAPVGRAAQFDARGSLPPVADIFGPAFQPAGFVPTGARRVMAH